MRSSPDRRPTVVSKIVGTARLVGGGMRPRPRPTILLTTVGRRTGQERTTPLVYVKDGSDYIVCNARPAGERRNPWVYNLRAAASGRIQHRGRTIEVTAEELNGTELEQWWPKIVDVWPAFADHYANTGERTMFRLRPNSSGRP